MAVIKRIASKATPKKIYNYLTQEEKTEEKLISGLNCNADNMVNEFNATKELYDKNNGVKYHHVIQSFDPKDNITPEKAHELGKELAENQFKGHEVLVVTHKDKEHIHNHFIVNSVSFENGLKYNASNKSLWDIKRESNRICERENLKTLDLDHRAKERLTSGELRKELRGETTWKGELKECISFAKGKANNLEEFQKCLKINFNIDSRVTNKTISYKHPERTQSIRGSKLGANYDKEELLNEFTRKEKSINTGETSRGNAPNVDWSAIGDNVKGEGNRISEQPSNDVIGEIQRKVQGVKERADRATGEYEEPSKAVEGKQQSTERENGGISKGVHRQSQSRDFDFDR
ncbi:relaxase/mobilization nuclease domain-containing protein [Clostridium cibarium]|uniref:Relaxase/mobilization nuclease domain-containing protein n=1 Tax=Clostridium cibarium TaxID=2762247 RepID=A0ABR8PZ76_9CLOT|nr:relaxase/mobilization nuclease domain-containing protein [Clostridium cibarium]MBD7913475.1 relaxase/mobilization nuclease domain-containing protein [Clostridium cibarium]